MAYRKILRFYPKPMPYHISLLHFVEIFKIYLQLLEQIDVLASEDEESAHFSVPKLKN